MFNKDKDILTGEDTYSGEHTEELEYYNMDLFERKVMKRLDQLDEKIDTVLHEVEDNQHRLKGIQFQFTRALIIRLIKLGFIVAVIWYVYNNFISPIIIGAGDKYYQAENMMNRIDSVRGESDGLMETAKGLFPDIGSALDSIRPDTSTSTVEN